MEIKTGRDRYVFVFASRGFVIKFPRIYLSEAAGGFFGNVIRRQWKQIRIFWNASMNGGFSGYKFQLFAGMVANWRERRFYRETRHTFLQPTYFSLFGLLNIQRYGEPLQMDGALFWKRMYCIVPEVDLIKDTHHFRHAENFHWDGARLYILDYGRKQTQQVVAQYGTEIQQFFLP